MSKPQHEQVAELMKQIGGSTQFVMLLALPVPFPSPAPLTLTLNALSSLRHR